MRSGRVAIHDSVSKPEDIPTDRMVYVRTNDLAELDSR